MFSLAQSKYTSPTDVGNIPNLEEGISERKVHLIDETFKDLSQQLDVPCPKRGTVSGTTSVFRWGPRDILMSEELLKHGDDKLIKKVAAHEFFHAVQKSKHKPMALWFLREPEAEAHALHYAMTGKAEDIPLIYHPNVLVDQHTLLTQFEGRQGASTSGCSCYSCFILSDFYGNGFQPRTRSRAYYANHPPVNQFDVKRM